jgi:hypothetical protein
MRRPPADREAVSDDVVAESAEIARLFPHPDSAEVARCNRRLDVSCPKEMAIESTNALIFVEHAARTLTPKCWLLDPADGVWL